MKQITVRNFHNSTAEYLKEGIISQGFDYTPLLGVVHQIAGDWWYLITMTKHGAPGRFIVVTPETKLSVYNWDEAWQMGYSTYRPNTAPSLLGIANGVIYGSIHVQNAQGKDIARLGCNQYSKFPIVTVYTRHIIEQIDALERIALVFKEWMQCPACHGEGRVTLSGEWSHDDQTEPAHECTCPECDGTGYRKTPVVTIPESIPAADLPF